MNVPFGHGACGGLLRACGYAVGATQMAKSQASEFKDGVLGKFSDQSLADYWYGDVAAEISVSDAPNMFYDCCFEVSNRHNSLITLSFGPCCRSD